MKRVRARIAVASIATVSMVLGACSSSSDSEPAAETTPVADMGEPTSDSAPSGPTDASTLYTLVTDGEGQSMRFDACTGPIRILLNPGNMQDEAAPYTDVDVAAQIGELFTEYAQELAGITGFEIEYGGITDLGLDPALAETNVIVFHFGATGFPGRENEYVDDASVFGATTDGWLQIVNYQHFENSNGFAIHFQEGAKLAGDSRDVGIDEAGKRWLKTVLGKALGLQELNENDMLSANIPTEEHGAQIMYTDSHQEQDGVFNLTWGEGDKAGLVAIGATNACFE